MDIPDPPDRPICAAHGPLKWGWFSTTRHGPRWVSFTVGDGGVLVPHICHNPGVAMRWEPDERVARRAREHAGAIRAQLGWTSRHTEETTTP